MGGQVNYLDDDRGTQELLGWIANHLGILVLILLHHCLDGAKLE
jgi:hypothetical protein